MRLHQAPVVTLAGMNAAPINTAGNFWTATVVVAAGATQGEVPYAIGFQDLAGNSGTTATASSDGSKVVIDTVAPTIIAPADQVAVATGPDGALVNYPSASATDHGVSIGGLLYSHGRETKFPIGLTTVVVTATDAAGNVATAQLQVTVGDQRESLPAARRRACRWSHLAGLECAGLPHAGGALGVTEGLDGRRKPRSGGWRAGFPWKFHPAHARDWNGHFRGWQHCAAGREDRRRCGGHQWSFVQSAR